MTIGQAIGQDDYKAKLNECDDGILDAIRQTAGCPTKADHSDLCYDGKQKP